VLPWSSFWERNYFGYAWPPLRPVLMNHFIRGAVTGLGFVNLIAGFAELAPLFALRGSPEVPVSDSADSRGSV
jgi:hypothetical protein